MRKCNGLSLASIRYWLFLPLLWLGFSFSNLYGQGAVTLHEEVQKLGEKEQKLFKDISDQLRCPTCTGLSILQSDAPFSMQIRTAVLEQVKQGKTEADILEFFTERYGLWILREPPTEGFHLFAWLIPVFLMIFGPLAIWFFVWRKRIEVSTYGVRSAEAILFEMEAELSRLRESSHLREGGSA